MHMIAAWVMDFSLDWGEGDPYIRKSRRNGVRDSPPRWGSLPKRGIDKRWPIQKGLGEIPSGRNPGPFSSDQAIAHGLFILAGFQFSWIGIIPPGSAHRSVPDQGFPINISSLESVWAPRALSVLRITSALIFTLHGSQKLAGFPEAKFQPELLSLMGIAVDFVVGGSLHGHRRRAELRHGADASGDAGGPRADRSARSASRTGATPSGVKTGLGRIRGLLRRRGRGANGVRHQTVLDAFSPRSPLG
jgi:hypothetical protein